MSLRLIVMRHAKSSWGTPDLEDHARSLNDRGRRSAAAIGAWLQERGYVPETVLSSDAQRTRETWAEMAGAFGHAPTVAWQPTLYLAGAGALFTALQNAQGGTVLLLAHNPGIAGFAHALLAQPPRHPRFLDYPTAATLVATFAAERWADVAPGTGRAEDFVVPRDLIA